MNAGGALPHTIVFATKGPHLSQPWPLPEEPAVIRAKDCAFAPHVLGVRAGQPIRLVNDDDT